MILKYWKFYEILNKIVFYIIYRLFWTKDKVIDSDMEIRENW